MDYVDTFKLVAGGVIWLQAIVGGVAPLFLKGRVRPEVTSVLNMFAGGIFLAGSTMHLLPDAQENEALVSAGCFSNGGKCFQLANFFYALGFLLVMMLEVFAHSIQQRFGDGSALKHNQIDEHTPLILNNGPMKSKVTPHEDAHEVKQNGIHTNGHHPSHHHNDQDHISRASHDGPKYGLSGLQPANGLPSDGQVCVDMEVTHAHIHGIMDANPALAFIVFAALSFHSVMEGMGVGASNGAAWDILVAILAHKSLAAFALTLELLHHKVPRERIVTTLGMFSLMSPLGIFLGWLLVDATKETAASGICSAMAGGTFLFVAVMETIPQELQNQQWLLVKCSALLLGFVAMGLLSIWT